MKWTTIASAICCAFGSLIFLGSLIMPNWRVGVGNWFMTDNPGVASWALFAYKQYGPLWTFGVYFQTWGSIAGEVCQKMRVVIGLSVVEGLGEEFIGQGTMNQGYCIGGPGSGCADTFAQHFQDRCSWYAQLSSLGSAIMIWVGIAFLINLGCCMTIFLTRLKDSKFTIMCTLSMVQFMAQVAFWVWMGVSSMAFHRLGQTGTYPYPGVGAGAITFMVGTLLHLTGVVTFWWFKFGPGKSPPGTDPRAQRAMAMGVLADQQRRMSGGSSERGSFQGVAPIGGVPPGNINQPVTAQPGM